MNHDLLMNNRILVPYLKCQKFISFIYPTISHSYIKEAGFESQIALEKNNNQIVINFIK